jgi:hypothetical protein
VLGFWPVSHALMMSTKNPNTIIQAKGFRLIMIFISISFGLASLALTKKSLTKQA